MKAETDHGTRAVVAELIEEPGWGRGQNRRTFGRRMVRAVVARCVHCRFADVDRDRIRRMHSAYRRRGAW